MFEKVLQQARNLVMPLMMAITPAAAQADKPSADLDVGRDAIAATTASDTINYKDFIKISPEVSQDRAKDITAYLDFMASTPEGEDVLRRVKQASGEITITADSTEECKFLLGEKILNLNDSQVLYNSYETATGFHPFSMERTITHELVHASDPQAVAFYNWKEQNWPRAEKIDATIDSLITAAPPKVTEKILPLSEESVKLDNMAAFLSDGVEKTARDVTSDFMAKYFGEPPRTSVEAVFNVEAVLNKRSNPFSYQEQYHPEMQKEAQLSLDSNLPQDRAEDITKILDNFAATPEGRDLLSRVAQNAGDVTITSIDGEKSTFDWKSGQINLDYKQIIENGYEHDGSVQPFSLERVLFHELSHAADPDFEGHREAREAYSDSIRTAARLQGQLPDDEMEKYYELEAEINRMETETLRHKEEGQEEPTVRETDTYMAKYYGEPPRGEYSYVERDEPGNILIYAREQGPKMPAIDADTLKGLREVSDSLDINIPPPSQGQDTGHSR